jgi:hypothetical protein
MNRMKDRRKEHCLSISVPLASLVAATLLLGATPAGAQTRTHNPTKPAPKPAPTSPTPTPPTPTPPAPSNPPPTNPAPASPAPTTPAPTSPTPPPATPRPTPPPSSGSGTATIATAAHSMRGLLIGVDVRAGSITVARHGYPPLPMKVAAGAAITRDGAPAKLSDLETGSQTSVPDALLVSAVPTADGGMLASKIRASSRNHYWYGRLTVIDPSTTTIRVLRADGQQRTFHLHFRTTITQFGAKNVQWSAMKTGSMVEVIWIPADSDAGAAIYEADRIILNKPYAGLPVRR